MTLSNIGLHTTDANAIITLHAFLKMLRVNVTWATVQESLEHHPEFPSLLSLSDALTEWGVENAGSQLNTTEQLRELPIPFIAHFYENGGWYMLITDLKGDRITYIDTIGMRKTESLTAFEKRWSGIVLVAESNEQSGEPDYATKRKQERITELRVPSMLAGILFVTLVGIVSVAQNLTSTDWILLLTKTTGLILSGLLAIKELGIQNTLTDRLCRINSKTSCDSVLRAPGAKLWGWLSWTDVGLIYFSGGVLFVVTAGILPTIHPLIYGLAISVLPYTMFSVYYQARIVKQWCPLCLSVQGVLLIEGILAFIKMSILPTQPLSYLLTTAIFIAPAIGWLSIKPLLINFKERNIDHNKLMTFKRNTEVFRTLLTQQHQMPYVSNNLHPIVIGSSEAKHVITVITNPYCSPCAEMHKELEELLACNKSIRADIIFACDSPNGRITRLVAHIMSLPKIEMVPEALSYWYGKANKNYNEWAERYQISEINLRSISVINEQRNWCKSNNVLETPTVYIDGYEMPKIYKLRDLKWVINTSSVLHVNQ